MSGKGGLRTTLVVADAAINFLADWNWFSWLARHQLLLAAFVAKLLEDAIRRVQVYQVQVLVLEAAEMLLHVAHLVRQVFAVDAREQLLPRVQICFRIDRSLGILILGMETIYYLLINKNLINLTVFFF